MPKTFLEFLQEKGKTNATDEEKKLLYQEHRRLYFKEKNAEKRQTHRRTELWYSKEEFKELEIEAENLEMKVAEMLKGYIQGYRKKQYIRPMDSKMRLVTLALNKWGSNLNQISYKNNALGFLTTSDVAELKDLFYKISSKIENELQYIPLEEMIRAEFEKNPRFLEHLIQIIETLKNKKAC